MMHYTYIEIIILFKASYIEKNIFLIMWNIEKNIISDKMNKKKYYPQNISR